MSTFQGYYFKNYLIILKKTPLKSKKRSNYIWGFIFILILNDSEEDLILFCGNAAEEAVRLSFMCK